MVSATAEPRPIREARVLLLHLARSQRCEHLAMALLRNSTRRKPKGRRALQVSEVPELARCPKKEKLDMLLVRISIAMSSAETDVMHPRNGV
ncbi:unnamed protein product [Sphagnum jensenii]|uniref:Uncharacterized protein n=1 Tax=Sphagnum jensenii TaxID=128206 RepID=A0ABP1ADQ0_9BRYO